MLRVSNKLETYVLISITNAVLLTHLSDIGVHVLNVGLLTLKCLDLFGCMDVCNSFSHIIVMSSTFVYKINIYKPKRRATFTNLNVVQHLQT